MTWKPGKKNSLRSVANCHADKEIRDVITCNSIKGIDNTKRSKHNKENFQLNILNGDILQCNFYGADTYYIWIEDPYLEMEIIDRINAYVKNELMLHNNNRI